MDSRERVVASLTFKTPDRVPRDIWLLPHTLLYQRDKIDLILKEFPMDLEVCEIKPGANIKELEKTSKIGSYKDEWGSIWYLSEPGVVGEVKTPFIDCWAKLRQFKPPYGVIKDRDAGFINSLHENSSKFILSDVTARIFERLQFLRGTENLFMDIAYDRPELYRLIKMVHEFYLEDINFWCKTNVDGIFFMDDLGTNISMLISPESWRRLFKPLYKEYCDMIHDAGKFTFFHTDGNTSAIFSEFIDVGVDAINSQIFIMDIEELSQKYRGKITFWGEMDRQKILPFGSPKDIQEAVARIRRVLDNGEGGVIAQCEWGKNIKAENIRAVFTAWDDK